MGGMGRGLQEPRPHWDPQAFGGVKKTTEEQGKLSEREESLSLTWVRMVCSYGHNNFSETDINRIMFSQIKVHFFPNVNVK